MTGCPDPSSLEAFMQGRLDVTMREGMERHLDGCSTCARTLAELARLYGSASWAAATMASHPVAQPGPHEVTVGRYQLGRRLGAGGMGVVFEAHDPELHRQVAVKLLHPGTSADPETTRERLLREARAMARLAHPNVVAVHDVGRAGDQVFVAMELVVGATLRQWLATERRSQAEILKTFVAAGNGLQAAHEVGLVHRDFKPDNVLIGPGTRARVTDFGLAQPALSWAQDAAAPAVPDGADLMLMSVAVTTAHGAIEGTPAYMAPEQWRGQQADARSDQFSFCVALYEALFSARPFAGRDWPSLCHNVLRGEIIPPRRSAPRWLRRALVRGLAVDPGRRYASMESLLRTLDRPRRNAVRVLSVGAAMAAGAAATVGVLRWAADETTLVDPEADDDEATAAQITPEATAVTAVDRVAPTVADAAVQCAARAADVDGKWTPSRRDRLTGQLAALSGPYALDVNVVALVDAWAESFAAVAGPACRAEASPRQAACLQRAAQALDALVLAASDKSDQVLAAGVAGAVYDLPPPERCASEPWLAAQPEAVPAELQAPVALLRADLAVTHAHVALGSFLEAQGAAEHDADVAASLDAAAVRAEAALAMGELEVEQQRTDAAEPWLQKAALDAESSGHGEVRAKAALALFRFVGAEQRLPEDAKRWERIAQSQTEQLGDARLQASLLANRGHALAAVLEFTDARRVLTDALAVHQAAFGDDHPATAAVQVALAAVEIQLGDAAAATLTAKTAVERLQRSVGTHDLRVGRALTVQAQAELAAGNLAAARAMAQRAAELPNLAQSLRHDYDRGDALLVLGDVAWAAGDVAAAEAAYTRAETFHYKGARALEPTIRRGLLLAQTDRVAQAVPLLVDAVAASDAWYGDAEDPRHIPTLRALGRTQLAAKQLSAAHKTLARALSIAESKVGYGPFTARCQLDLADAERARGRAREALTLLDDAHVPLASAYDLDHPIVIAELLARADLAYTLRDTAYAARLYGVSLADIVAHYGESSPEARRARARGEKQ